MPSVPPAAMEPAATPSGTGGIVPPPAGYWAAIQGVLDKHDILLMLDEVITGYGRTGNWFAAQTFGLEPDTITTAKALTSGYQPLSALLVGDRIANTLVEKGGEFYHGYTYSGHPVACAVALKNLEIIEREGLVARVREETGPYFAQQLATRISPHPIVGEVRSVGLMGAIEIVADRGIARHVPDSDWQAVCGDMRQRLAGGDFEGGVIAGIEAIRERLDQHLPGDNHANPNELPDRPIVL